MSIRFFESDSGRPVRKSALAFSGFSGLEILTEVDGLRRSKRDALNARLLSNLPPHKHRSRASDITRSMDVDQNRIHAIPMPSLESLQAQRPMAAQ